MNVKLSFWLGIAALLLAGCSGSPDFAHEPPASYRVPLSADIQGVWAREGKDNGERARVSALDDGTVRIDFFSTQPDAKHIPDTPLVARALRFDNTDWLLIDRNKLSGLDHSQYTGTAPYRLIKYVLEDATAYAALNRAPACSPPPSIPGNWKARSKATLGHSSSLR